MQINFQADIRKSFLIIKACHYWLQVWSLFICPLTRCWPWATLSVQSALSNDDPSPRLADMASLSSLSFNESSILEWAAGVLKYFVLLFLSRYIFCYFVMTLFCFEADSYFHTLASKSLNRVITPFIIQVRALCQNLLIKTSVNNFYAINIKANAKSLIINNSFKRNSVVPE